MNRREFLGAAALASLALSTRVRAAPRKRPRYLVHLLLRGGFDAILTTDPKLRDEIDPRVDRPYEDHDIIDLGTHRVGPMFEHLRADVPAMAILNGVDHGTVAHDYGLDNVLHMRRSYPIRNELGVGIAGSIGRALGETPLDEAWLIGSALGLPTFMPARKALVMQNYNNGDDSLLGKLWQVSNDHANASVASKVLADEARHCEGECSSLKALGTVIDKMAGTELPAPASFSIALDDQTNANLVKGATVVWARIARDITFMLQHDLTRTVYCAVPHAFFDTHQNNLPGQRRSCLVVGEGLNVLFAMLRHAGLFDDTAFVISSELGRNPFLNSAAGKDHFPQHPVIFMGPGIRPGQYGKTDRTMAAIKISEETGTDVKPAIAPTLDDIGATICRWFGVDGEALGYTARPLGFLFE